jgi:uncharacterized protein (DUF486 family)
MATLILLIRSNVFMTFAFKAPGTTAPNAVMAPAAPWTGETT